MAIAEPTQKIETGINFKLVPLIINKDGKVIPNGQAILSNWQYFTEGIEKVLSFSTGDSSYEKVLNEILAGHLTLFVGFLDGKYVGFCTTRLDTYLLSDTYITIVHLYIKPGTDENIFYSGFDYLYEKLCKPNKAKLRFFSSRNGWTKRLLSKGWKTGYTEFVYEQS